MSKVPFALLMGWLLLALASIPAGQASADVGPKPGMEFELVPQTSDFVLPLVRWVQYECDQPDCRDARPLQQLGAQGFFCSEQVCRSSAYGYSQYHYIELTYSDGKTRQSNVFETVGFNSWYTVKIRQHDLLVEPQFRPLGYFHPYLVLFFCCLAVLGVILGASGLLIFFVRKQ